MFLSEQRISLRLLESATYSRLPLWEASLGRVASVRFRAKNEGRQALLERAHAEFESILYDPKHDWRTNQPGGKRRSIT